MLLQAQWVNLHTEWVFEIVKYSKSVHTLHYCTGKKNDWSK